MKKHAQQENSESNNELSEEEKESLRRYLEVVHRIYQSIQNTPAGEQLRLKVQWRKRLGKIEMTRTCRTSIKCGTAITYG